VREAAAIPRSTRNAAQLDLCPGHWWIGSKKGPNKATKEKTCQVTDAKAC